MIAYPQKRPYVPVSIADLPGHTFSVSPNTKTEKVVAKLEKQGSLPGAMIIENGQLLGIITRLKLFERLGHCASVDALLQKSVFQLKDLIRIRAQPLPGDYRLDEALQYALNRPGPDVYDPIVVLHDDGTMRLLDINLLLLAQSRAMANLNNVAENLEKIDRQIDSGDDRVEIFEQVLQLLQQSVPYHQSGILAIDETGIGFVAFSGYKLAPKRADEILDSATYSLIMKHRQAIYISNVNNFLAWNGMEALGRPVSWLGLPLLVNTQALGLLSIGRNVERPFSNDERETALAFAQRITELLKREQQKSSHLFQLSGTQEYVGIMPAREIELDRVVGENISFHAALRPVMVG